jgi:hypothetical protein
MLVENSESSACRRLFPLVAAIPEPHLLSQRLAGECPYYHAKQLYPISKSASDGRPFRAATQLA